MKKRAGNGAKKKTPRKRCSVNGCRKLRVSDQYCADHEKEKAESPLEAIARVTEIEALRFTSMDAELRNHLQGKKIINLEIEKADRDHALAQEKKRRDLGIQQNEIDRLQPEYSALIDRLGEKYGIEPKNISLDPDTLIIRDLSQV